MLRVKSLAEHTEFTIRKFNDFSFSKNKPPTIELFILSQENNDSSRDINEHCAGFKTHAIIMDLQKYVHD